MNFIQLLACDPDFVSILKIVRWALNLICWIVPIVLIVLATLDIAKVVMAGNIDDKVKKEATSKLATRAIYAVIIFLIPTIVGVLFKWLPLDKVTMNGSDWNTCWQEAGK